MPFTAQRFASKLVELRTSYGATPAEIAAATGIAVERLRLLEEARQPPTGDEILIVADHFRCDFEWLIEDDAANSDQNLTVLFRTEGGRLSNDDRRSISDFLHLCKSQKFLEDILEVPVPRRPFSFTPTGRHYKAQGQDCAARFRDWYGLQPNALIPDVFHWLRSIGIKVFRRELPNSTISGLFVRHPEAGPCILVNYTEDVYRQRFSAAHEAGHALMDVDRNFNVSDEGDLRSQDLHEVRANAFASDFLLPPALLRSMGTAEKWRNPDTLEEAAGRLFVSVPALLAALRKAELIDEATRKELRKMRLRAQSKADPELGDSLTNLQRRRRQEFLSMGLNDQYVSMCFEAHRRGEISLGRLADMLLVAPGDVGEIAAIFGSSLHHG